VDWWIFRSENANALRDQGSIKDAVVIDASQETCICVTCSCTAATSSLLLVFIVHCSSELVFDIHTHENLVRVGMA
jgi:hypothetical protein